MSSYALFQGPDLAVEFLDAEDALAYMARNADELADGEAALFVFDDEGHAQIALVDARAADEGPPRELVMEHAHKLGFRDLERLARWMLDTHYPEDLFGEAGMFPTDPGSRFTQHLRAALAVIDERDGGDERKGASAS